MAPEQISTFFTKLPSNQKAFIRAFQNSGAQKSFVINGIPWNYYDSQTNGPVLLLLHGGFADYSMWMHQIMAFKSDFRVIAPTCPPFPKATMQIYAKALGEIVRVEKIERLNIMGYSEGGLIAQCFLREQQAHIDKAIFAHTFFPTPKNKYYQFDFKLFRMLPAPLTTFIFRFFAQPDKEELAAETPWQAWFRAYFKELKSKLTKPLILTHIDLMMDFVRNYSFNPDDLTSWNGRLLITVARDDVVFQYFDGLNAIYPFAEIHIFEEGLGAHSIALISPKIFNQRIRAFFED